MDDLYNEELGLVGSDDDENNERGVLVTVEKEVQMDLTSFVLKFANPKIIQALTYVPHKSLQYFHPHCRVPASSVISNYVIRVDTTQFSTVWTNTSPEFDVIFGYRTPTEPEWDIKFNGMHAKSRRFNTVAKSKTPFFNLIPYLNCCILD